MRSFDYYSPPSLQEAFSLLSRFGEQARALAGGTDLIVQMKAGKTRPSAIIDVKNLAELKRLEWITPDTLFIGAAVP